MPEPRLVCLPPAGGGPSLFTPWRRVDAGVEAPSLPGRETRFREPPPESLLALAELLAAELAPKPPRRYALFGYSMGGTVAFLLAERLVARGLPGPEAFFVLGALPPRELAAGAGGFHELEGEAFWGEIARMGGTPAEVLRDAEMRALFEPGLRDDFRLCATYRHRDSGFALSCPLHVFRAEDDHVAPEASAAGWSACTTGPTRLHRLRGGHMLDREALLALRARIRALASSSDLAGAPS